MKVLTRFIVAGFLVFTGLINAEEACEPAVDVADSLDVNATMDCNYEETGLNGVVHKLFNRDTAKPAPSDSSPDNLHHADQSVIPENQVESAFVANARELAAARYQLLQNISDQCSHEFRLLDERYSSRDKAIKVKLGYECLGD